MIICHLPPGQKLKILTPCRYHLCIGDGMVCFLVFSALLASRSRLELRSIFLSQSVRVSIQTKLGYLFFFFCCVVFFRSIDPNYIGISFLLLLLSGVLSLCSFSWGFLIKQSRFSFGKYQILTDVTRYLLHVASTRRSNKAVI